MKALIFGTTGQVAHELARRAPKGAQITALGRNRVDLTNPAACAAAIAASDADVVINAAAYTNVDGAETDEALAQTINATAPGAMAQACAARALPFLHISTDYVFDGSGSQPWQPDDAPAPLGAYGRSKLAGEAAIRAATGPHAILRTSWIFSAHGRNFVKTVLRLAQTNAPLRIVGDQLGGPTAAADIADALWVMAQHMHQGDAPGGTYHFAGTPDVSWADFAREILAQAKLPAKVQDITTADYPTPALRPANSRLNCSVTEAEFGILRPDWRKALTQVLTELSEARQ